MNVTMETRRESLSEIIPKVPAMEAYVLGALISCGPMSAEQIMDKLGTQNPNNVRPRLTGLRDKGLIEPIDKRVNSYGRNEAIWAVVDKKTAPRDESTEGGRSAQCQQNTPSL